MQAPDFPWIHCSCNVKTFGRDFANYAIAESQWKTGGSSRVLYSEVPTSEMISIELTALTVKQFSILEAHWDDSNGMFSNFLVPIRKYASNIRGAKKWLERMHYIDGLWRYESKPETPPPQPEGFNYTVRLISEN